MERIKWLFFLAMSMGFWVQAQTPAHEIGVKVQAIPTFWPPSIQLEWRVTPTATAYTVYRKMASGSAWGGPYASLSSTDSTFTDTNVVVGEVYEYRIVKSGTSVGNGYITASIQRPAVHHRGMILFVTDSVNLSNPGFEIALTQAQDATRMDGWDVRRLVVQENWPVTQVKDSIQALYMQHPQELKALYLIGRVPVPYSGNMNPDGHPDHEGAWPTDLYYADVSGPAWSDATISNTIANDPRNHNVPSDGKFDHNVVPSLTELMVGRVDFRDLPEFATTDTELLTRYLIKTIDYKHANFRAVDRALVDDNFTGYAEGFAASGYRSFTPMVGLDSLKDATDFFSASSSNNGETYLWGYGCGAGWYTSCSGVGTTTNFAADSLQMVFSMLFGSYFGDWDTQNNLLRASLAQGWTLSTAWAGRPHWVFHPMALGEPIGHAAFLTQNNISVYHTSTLNAFGRWIHINLLGDPTLRIHYLTPPTQLLALDQGNVELIWASSTDPVLGYHVYRRHADSTQFVLLNASPVPGPTFTDSLISRPATYFYMVKAVELDSTASGTYYNLSLGSETEISLLVGQSLGIEARITAYPNPSDGRFWVTSHGLQGQVTLIDLQGRILLAAPISGVLQMDLATFPAGIYLLKGEFGESGSKVIRLVKK